MYLTVTNPQKVESFNFLHLKPTFEKRRLNNNNSNCYETTLINYNKKVFNICINHTKKTISVNGLEFTIITGRDYVWNFNKKTKTVQTASVEYLQKELKNACNKSNVFHRTVYEILKNLTAN